MANAIVEALESHGIECWIAPRDVVPGEFYAGAIVHAIDAAKVIVLVLSKSAATPQHVLREVERASTKRHPVVSFRTDLSPMPADLEYFLNTSQWLVVGEPFFNNLTNDPRYKRFLRKMNLPEYASSNPIPMNPPPSDRFCPRRGPISLLSLDSSL